MLALKKIATWDERGRCWLPCGMGALKADGSIVPNGWNRQPAPIIEPLVTYWLATGDLEGLDFAREYAEGMMNNLQPDGIRFQQEGKDITGGFPFGAHSHATMHAVWGSPSRSRDGRIQVCEFLQKCLGCSVTPRNGYGLVSGRPG